jgi:hypothetical protein
MIGLRTSAPSFATLVVGLLLMVLSVGCSKQNDDCAAPDNSTDGTARMMSQAPAGTVDVDPTRPQGATRDPLIFGAGSEDEGISDDGDDEADGEGSNKRAKPQ